MATLTETITKTLTVTGIPTLNITSAAGKITVMTGANNQIHIEATKRASGLTEDGAQQALNSIATEITQQGDAITVASHYQTNWIAMGLKDRRVDFIITVPERTNITAQQAAGGVQIRGVRGKLGIRIAAGDVHMQDIIGTLTLQASAGNTDIEHFGGILDIKSSAGAVKLHDITLTHDSLLKLSAGNLNFAGALVPHASLAVESSAGKIDMQLPADTSAHLDAATTAGKISIDGWPIVVKRGFGPQATAEGDLSDNPVGTLRLHSTAGSISLAAR